MCLSCTVFELYRVFRRNWRILTHPACICRPRRGWSRSNFAVNFGVRKKTSHKAIVWCYLCDPMFSHFDTMLECDRHTHTHTHTHTQRQSDRHTTAAYTALSIASHSKKHSSVVFTASSNILVHSIRFDKCVFTYMQVYVSVCFKYHSHHTRQHRAIHWH